ncbi:MAG: ABC transporter permease [Chloracidobacterium sp.]|nr:ABC transporter permease [Chloracidobacterium sp.]
MNDLITNCWSNLVANKLRTLLTMFGIVWGVVSILILSAASEGFQRGNQKTLEDVGKNVVIIRNGRTSMQAGGERAGKEVRLTLEDVFSLKENAKLLEALSPELSRPNIRVKSSFNSGAFSVSGVWAVYQRIRAIDLAGGRSMSELDDEQVRRVAIIGFEVSKQLFADRDPIGGQVRLNGIPYTVIGKIRKKPKSNAVAGSDDNRIFVPYRSMRKDFPLPEATDTSNAVTAIVASPYQSAVDDLKRIISTQGKISVEMGGPVESEIRSILAARHDFDPQDPEAVLILNTALNSAFLGKLVSGIREFFIMVSVVTLGLGGIGMMNIMLISVKERTREIGIRKALGAKPRSIQWQFFNEGLFLTLSSGIIGLSIGVGICALINLAPMPENFDGMIITWQMAFISIITLLVIGIAAATYPARRAAALPPIEALRFEM